jgi:poly(hydroxyalkanoate) depolymerase family esterase
MMEALRLTRQGKLEEAMAVLRGVSPAAEAAPTRPTGNATIIDMVPPSDRSGSAWTAAPAGAEPGAAPSSDKAPTKASARGAFFDRLRRPQSATPSPMPPAGATFESHVFANEAGSRSYKLYVPSLYKGEPLPLVVMLHGCTQSPDDFAAGTRMNEYAEEQMFLVAYPAQPKSANPGNCWNWFDSRDQQRGHGEPSLIAGITRRIMQDYPVETGRVYVAGLSAGGAAAAIMGATYPDLYAAIGVHSGLACGAARDLPSAFRAMRDGGDLSDPSPAASGTTVPTIVFHGARDTTVNPLNGDQIIAQATPAASLRTTVVRDDNYVCTIQVDTTGRSVLEHWVLPGIGHAWSGGSPNGSYTDCRGPDASREMIRFFLQHSVVARPGAR